MSEENAPQKERYLREVEQKLLRKELDARLLEDGLIHVRWNESHSARLTETVSSASDQRISQDRK